MSAVIQESANPLDDRSGKRLIPFRVRLVVDGEPRELPMLACSSIDAVLRALEFRFPGADAVMDSLSIKVEPIGERRRS